MSLKSIADHIGAYVAGFYEGELKPWIKNLLTTISHDLVTALMPLAHEALQELENSAGSISLANIGAAIEATAAKGAAAGLTIVEHDVLAAVTTAVAERAQTAAAGGPAA